MGGLPFSGGADPGPVLNKIKRGGGASPTHYERGTPYPPRHCRQTTALDYIVQRPAAEPGFRLDRQEVSDRRIAYTLHSYAAERPHGDRYRNGHQAEKPKASQPQDKDNTKKKGH